MNTVYPIISRSLPVIALLAVVLLIGYALFPGGGVRSQSDEYGTATPHLPESEDDISEDEVARGDRR